MYLKIIVFLNELISCTENKKTATSIIVFVMDTFSGMPMNFQKSIFNVFLMHDFLDVFVFQNSKKMRKSNKFQF